MMTSGYNFGDLLQEAQIRWLKPAEVLFILQNFDEKQLTYEPPQKPPSGSLFLFNKRVLRYFRKDGHNWRRKKDGRTVAEAFERLKVGNAEALNCYYAHGELNPNFQRRCYWMLDPGMDHIVLVHYRNITMEPYDNTSSPSSTEVCSDVVTKSNGTGGSLSYTNGVEEIGGSPNFEIDQALRRIEEQLSLDEDNLKDISAFYNANEISNESEFSANEQTYGGMQDGSNNFASERYPGYNFGDLLQEAQIRWLKPAEVLFILQNFDEKQLTYEPPQKPPSGSLFLFNKLALDFFRKDGHNWRKKKDGRTVGEAHERLKVGNVEALNCYYAHGELDPNFQRRTYWMLDPGTEGIVLVHYRYTTMGGNSLNDQPLCMGTVRLLEHSQPSGGNDLYSSGQPPSIGALRLSEHSQPSGCSDDYACGQPPSMGSVRPLERSQLSGGSVGYAAGQPTPAWSCEVDSLSSS